jgi:hypothetical protein
MSWQKVSVMHLEETTRPSNVHLIRFLGSCDEVIGRRLGADDELAVAGQGRGDLLYSSPALTRDIPAGGPTRATSRPLPGRDWPVREGPGSRLSWRREGRTRIRWAFAPTLSGTTGSRARPERRSRQKGDADAGRPYSSGRQSVRSTGWRIPTPFLG